MIGVAKKGKTEVAFSKYRDYTRSYVVRRPTTAGEKVTAIREGKATKRGVHACVTSPRQDKQNF
jgi:hypothetical protein